MAAPLSLAVFSLKRITTSCHREGGEGGRGRGGGKFESCILVPYSSTLLLLTFTYNSDSETFVGRSNSAKM